MRTLTLFKLQAILTLFPPLLITLFPPLSLRNHVINDPELYVELIYLLNNLNVNRYSTYNVAWCLEVYII